MSRERQYSTASPDPQQDSSINNNELHRSNDEEANSLRKTVDELEGQLKRHESKYRGLERSFVELVDNKCAAEADLESSQEKVVAMRVENEELKAKIEKLQGINLKLTTKIGEQDCRLREQCIEYDTAIKILQENSVRLQEDVQSKVNIITALQDELNKNGKRIVQDQQQKSTQTESPSEKEEMGKEIESHALLAQEILRTAEACIVGQQQQQNRVQAFTKVVNSNNADDKDMKCWQAKVEEQLASLQARVEFLTQENSKLQLQGLMNFKMDSNLSASLPMPTMSLQSRDTTCELLDNVAKAKSQKPCLSVVEESFHGLVNGTIKSQNPTRSKQYAPTPHPLRNSEVNSESIELKVGLNNYSDEKDEWRKQVSFNGLKTVSAKPQYADKSRSGTNKNLATNKQQKSKTAAAGDFFKYQAAAALNPLMLNPPVNIAPRYNPVVMGSHDVTPKPQLHPNSFSEYSTATSRVRNSTQLTEPMEMQNGSFAAGFSCPMTPTSHSMMNNSFEPTQNLTARIKGKTEDINFQKNVTIPSPVVTRRVYQPLYAKHRLDVRNAVDLFKNLNTTHQNSSHMQAVPMYANFQHSFKITAPGGRKFVVHFWLTQRMEVSDVCVPYELRICFPKLCKETDSTLPSSYGNCFLKIKFLDGENVTVCNKSFLIAALSGTCENSDVAHMNCSEATLDIGPVKLKEFFIKSLESYSKDLRRSNITPTSHMDRNGSRFYALELELFLMVQLQLELPSNAITSKQIEILRNYQSAGHKRCWKIKLKIDLNENEGDDIYEVDPCLLGAYSRIFEKLSEENLETNKNKVVTLGVGKHTIQTFIAFVHGKPIKLDDVKEILEFLEFSFNYLISDFAQVCCEALIKLPDHKYRPELALEIWEFGMRFGNSELLERINRWTKKNNAALQTEEEHRIMEQLKKKGANLFCD